jgi:3'-phosphoadenosine 5'-phosphosulfate sulfotransferase (PAPS reductase)/FAD synthetase
VSETKQIHSRVSSKTIVVWFSCGAASAVAAKITIDKYGKDHNVRVVNNPIEEEHPDNQRFLKDVEQWLGIKIESATHRDYPRHSTVEVWAKRKYMAGIKGAPCTQILKKQARQQWEEKNLHDFLVLGFTSEEETRFNNFKRNERDNILPILIEAKLTKEDCFKIIQDAGIKLPEIYSLGYPNANCIGCVKATSVEYWKLVKRTFPDVFNQRAQMSRQLGARLVRVKGTRKFLDEIKDTDKGRPIKNMKTVECGIFCEEK